MKIAQLAVEEARMVLPGLQALFGFQMISVFNARFELLTDIDKHLHLIAILMTTLSIALIMTPAAYHRIVEPDTGSRSFIRLVSALIAAALVPLTISLSIDVYIAAALVAGRTGPSIMIALGTFVLLAALWFAYPLSKHR